MFYSFCGFLVAVFCLDGIHFACQANELFYCFVWTLILVLANDFLVSWVMQRLVISFSWKDRLNGYLYL